MDDQNRHRVSDLALQEFLDYVQDTQQKPLDVRYKTDGYPTLYWKAIYLAVCFYDLFNKGFREKFDTRISNADANIVLMPSPMTHGDWNQWNVYVILRHEYVHMQDHRRYGLWFTMSYVLFPFPILFAYMRADWEFRAYAQQLICAIDHYGYVWDELLDHILHHFCSATYLWMWPFRGTIRRKFERLIQDIQQGKIHGFYPDIHMWQY